MKISKYIPAALLALGLASCSGDFLDTENTEFLGSEEAGEAAGKNPDVFLNGAWSWFIDGAVANTGDHSNFSYMAVMLCTDVMTEDIAFSASHFFVFDYQLDYRNDQWMRTGHLWSTFYTTIQKANEIIGLYPNGAQTSSEKALIGQAYAMRGMSYYYLIQLYQDYMNTDGTINREAKGIPLMYTAADGKTEEEIAAAKSRNTVGAVLDQTGHDLELAVSLLEEADYSRPNKNYIDASVANGLLARYYLLTQQFQNAADAANKARQGYAMRTESGLHDGFMEINNPDVMWGFDQTTETQTAFASYFSHISNLAPGYAGAGYCPKHIDRRLYDQIPDNDYRKSLFNGAAGDASQPTSSARLPYANIKFGNCGDWLMDYIYMRAAEMVLIEAEAYARLNENGKAADVLKVLMANRQPGWSKTSVTAAEVQLQRRIELWGEGFAYFDLKRLNKGIDRAYAGTNHMNGCQLVVPAHDVRWTFQLPLREIQENSLISEADQNP